MSARPVSPVSVWHAPACLLGLWLGVCLLAPTALFAENGGPRFLRAVRSIDDLPTLETTPAVTMTETAEPVPVEPPAKPAARPVVALAPVVTEDAWPAPVEAPAPKPIVGTQPYLRVMAPVGLRFERTPPPADRTALLEPPAWVDHEMLAILANEERRAAKAEALAGVKPHTPAPAATPAASTEGAPMATDLPPGSPPIPADGVVVAESGPQGSGDPLTQAGQSSVDASAEFLVLFERQLRQGEAKIPFRLPTDGSAVPETRQVTPPGRADAGSRYRVIP